MINSIINHIATMIKCKIEILKILNQNHSEYNRGKIEGYLEVLKAIIPNNRKYNDWFEYINNIEEYIDNL